MVKVQNIQNKGTEGVLLRAAAQESVDTLVLGHFGLGQAQTERCILSSRHVAGAQHCAKPCHDMPLQMLDLHDRSPAGNSCKGPAVKD